VEPHEIVTAKGGVRIPPSLHIILTFTSTGNHMAIPLQLWNTIFLLNLMILQGQGNSSYNPSAKLPEVFVLEEPFSEFLQVVVVLAVIGFLWFINRLCQLACAVIYTGYIAVVP